MPPPYSKHVFICTNRRPDGSPKGSCAEKGSEELQLAFKKELDARGLKSSIRPNKAGCLDACERGCVVVVYPEGVWYGGVKVDDVKEIIEQHLVNNQPVKRLLMEPYTRKKDE